MFNVLATDLTGQLPANLVTEDIKLSRTNRAFPLGKGSFYTKSLRVVNKATQALLVFGKDYQIGALDIEAIRLTPQHEISNEIYMLNINIDEITVTYQAVGGEFQFNSVSLAAMLQEYFDTVGKTHIVNTPDQYKSSKHIQNINDFMKLGGVQKAIDRIEAAIKSGRGETFVGSLLAYAEELGNALSADVKKQVNELLENVAYLKKRNEYRDGRYYITSRSSNPGAEKGGAWTLDPNVTLYGAENGSQAGQLVNVGEGNGYIATFRHLWRRTDTGEIIIYELATSATDIDEGESVTISIKVTGLPIGSIVRWRLSGVDADDIVGGRLSGDFVLDYNGYASTTIGTVADRKTEGKETMRLSLVNAPTNYISVGINDTSLTPIYTVWFSRDQAGLDVITSINEGVEGYLQLSGNDLNQGERLYVLLDESTTDSTDFEIPLPQYMDIDNGRSWAKFKLRNDNLTEGEEIVVANICTTPSIASRQVRAILKVIDTSRSPAYSSKFTNQASGAGQITQANEGTVVYLVISGDNLVEGTQLQLSYYGTANADDFVNALPATATVRGGQAIMQYSIKNDLRTEGNELFGVSVKSGGVTVTDASLTIIDTSITVGYDMYFSSTSAGNDRISTVNEGDYCYMLVRTVGLADGTQLRLEYGGTATAVDFMVARPTTVTINGGVGIVNYGISNDRLTEGNESFTVTLADVADKPKATITILDTSLTPTISTKFSSNDRGTDVITSTPEGRSIYLIVQTTGVFDGETLGIRFGGNTNDDDFIGGRPTQVTIYGNWGVVEYKVKADAIAEGTERFDATVFYHGREDINSTSSIDILDTSVPPKLELTVYIGGVQQGDLNNLRAMSGQAVEIRITDVNKTLSDTATIFFNYNGNVAAGSITPTTRFTAGFPDRVQMSNWVARFNCTYTSELQGVETFAPMAFGLTAGEAAQGGGWTDTFKYVNIRHAFPNMNSWFSATQNGAPYPGPVDGSRPLWYVANSNNIPNGATGTLRVWVDGTYATVDNGLLINNYTGPMTFNGGYASQLLYPNPTAYNGSKNFEAFMQNNTLTSTVPGTTVGMRILSPPITEIDITGYQLDYAAYNGVNYTVFQALDLYHLFISATSRGPAVGERIRFTLREGYAVVGRNMNITGGANTNPPKAALLIDENFNVASEIMIVNRGVIVGGGGDGYSNSKGDDGGTAILNTSSRRVRYTNYNVIAGGGGAGGGNGATGWKGVRGGGGAPYGFGNRDGSNTANATFTVPLPNTYINGPSGGGGGEWAQPGRRGQNSYQIAPGVGGWSIRGPGVYEVFAGNGSLLGPTDVSTAG